MAINTLAFGDSDAGVGGFPTVDGMVDYDFLPFLAADPVESGYINGSRLTFEGGSLPRVFFQGTRIAAGDRLVMAFFTRFNTSFSGSDLVILAVQGSAASNPARLIAIRPNLDGVGATSGPGDGPNEIKRNIKPEFDVYQGSSGSWSQIDPPPASLDIKVRSWKPQRPAGSPDECAWSVEVSMPRNAGADWITLNDNFDLYFDVVRVFPAAGMAAQSPFPSGAAATDEPGPTFIVPVWGKGLIPALGGGNVGLGVRVRNGWQGVGRRDLGSSTTTLTGTIQGPAGSTDNELVAIVENTSPDSANGVNAEFRFANWGLPPPVFNLWDRPLGLLPNPTTAGNLAAAAQANMPTNLELKSPWPRNQVPAQYQSASHQCVWVQLSAGGTVNFTTASTRRNMDFVGFSDVERDAEVSGEGYPKPNDGSDTHQFMLQTFCREIRVAELIGAEQTDENLRSLVADTVTAVAPARLNINADTISVNARTRTQDWNDVVVYLWVTQGYRRMGTFIKLKGKLYENLDETPGEFGLSALHTGVNDNFAYAFSGPDLVRYAPGSYGLKVPNGGKVRLKVKVGASPDGPAGDRSELPRAPWPKPRGDGDGDTHRKGGIGCSVVLIFVGLGFAGPLLLRLMA